MQFYFSDPLDHTMEHFPLSAEDQEKQRILKLRETKAELLKDFSTEVKDSVNKLLDELLCEQIFNFHMELKTGILNPKYFGDKRPDIDEELAELASKFNITKTNDEVPCPSCHVPVKCHWLSKHLAVCVRPAHSSSLSFSSRNSSRIARQRIQEGFKTSYDDTKGDSDDEKPNKGKKRKRVKIKCAR